MRIPGLVMSAVLLKAILSVACATACPTCPAAATPAVTTPTPAPSAHPTKPTPVAAPALKALEQFDGNLPASPWPRKDAVEAGCDPVVLARLLEEAKSTGSDTLLILRDGKTVVERSFGKPQGLIETMSVTKSIVGLAVGLLIEEGKIEGLDTPVSTWFPSWKKGKKGKVTVRHLLTQTSGLAHRKNAGLLFQQRDMLGFALDSVVLEEPGTRFSYNNEATMILGGVIREAAGETVDQYLASRLFDPLGIEDWVWTKDKAGNVPTLSGLALTSRDLAKIGVMMLNGGRWQGKQVIPASWVKASTEESVPDSGYGFLWWLRYGLTKRTITGKKLDGLASDGFGGIDDLAELKGQTFLTGEGLWMEVGARLPSTQRKELAERALRGQVPYEKKAPEVIGFAADGWLGQALIVLPAIQVVAVRQHREPDGGADNAYNRKHGFFDLFKRLALACNG